LKLVHKKIANIFKETLQRKMADNIAKLNNVNLDNNSKQILELVPYRDEKLRWSEDNVRKVINGIKNKKCTGHDDIPIAIYKDSLELTLPALTKLFNKVAKNESIPSSWRLAKLNPIYKKGSKSNPDNYWPISNIVTILKT